MSTIESLAVLEAPHTHTNDTAAKRFWWKTAALTPVIIAAAITGGAGFLLTWVLSLVCGALSEYGVRRILGKKNELLSGETFLTANLLALCLPANCPAGVVAVGSFVAVGLAREFFGGLGAQPFHTVLFARIFLDACFCAPLGEAILFQNGASLWITGAVVMSGLLLMTQKRTRVGPPIGFMALAAAGLLFVYDLPPATVMTAVIFSGAFLLTEHAALPISPKGRHLFFAAAALLAIFFAAKQPLVTAVGFGVLTLNLACAWIDHWLAGEL